MPAARSGVEAGSVKRESFGDDSESDHDPHRYQMGRMTSDKMGRMPSDKPRPRRASVTALSAGLKTGGSAGPPVVPTSRRDSQAVFAARDQSTIIFDWDDTLFPTTYVRMDKGLKWNVPLKDQRLSVVEMKEVKEVLRACEDAAITLLKLANMVGNVMIVTLARSPWLSISCTNFFPRMGEAIKELEVPLLYAQDGVIVDQAKVNAMSEDEHEAFWSGMKEKTIKEALMKFYSRYEGQSWKNVISIGDSDFERRGTIGAVEAYLKSKGVSDKSDKEAGKVVDGHVIKVRSKTIKLVDEPSAEELNLELMKLQSWLPLLVKLDKSVDINVETLDNSSDLDRVERILAGED